MVTRHIRDDAGYFKIYQPETPGRTTRAETAPRLLWVICVDLGFVGSLPVYPDKQTFSAFAGMSQTGHVQTHAPQQKALFDHLVGTG
jgi:hypothetical protein